MVTYLKWISRMKGLQFLSCQAFPFIVSHLLHSSVDWSLWGVDSNQAATSTTEVPSFTYQIRMSHRSRCVFWDFSLHTSHFVGEVEGAQRDCGICFGTCSKWAANIGLASWCPDSESLPWHFHYTVFQFGHHWAESLQAAQIWQTYAGCFLETNRSLAISSNSPFMWPHINIRLLLLVSVKITKNKKQTWLDGNATYLKLKTKNLKRQKASGKVGKIQILWQKKKKVRIFTVWLLERWTPQKKNGNRTYNSGNRQFTKDT